MSYSHRQQPTQHLFRFNGGLHLPDNKKQSLTRPLIQAKLPKRLIIPLQQHIGTTTQPLVSVGDRVLKGQVLAKPQGYISAPIHAPSSGVIAEISELPVPHPSGLSAPCIVIQTDGRDAWCELPEPILDPTQADPDLLRKRIRMAGIVGLGGAAFPSSVKLTPGPEKPIHTLIINGAECEPYITCDDLLMCQHADDLLAGIHIIYHLVGAKQCLIGIEENKPEAIERLARTVAEKGLGWVSVVSIPTLYPSGGEKQLIRILTGKEVPSGGIPAQIGMICHNVTTAYMVAEAVLKGKPLISRYVTITGNGVKTPRNLEVLIGTPMTELIEQAGGYTGQAAKLIMGGPMMGFTLGSDEVPVTKACNCLLVADATEAPTPPPALACIRCGQCAAVCPANLLPQQMYWYARAKDLEKTQEYNLFDCIECGCCSHVCPSHIPLVQYFRYAKTESWGQEKAQLAAELARERYDAQQARKGRLENERKAKLRKKREVLANKPKPTGATAVEDDPKRAAIQAAMKRAAEKKAQQATTGVKPKNIDDLTPAQEQAIAQADVRRDVSKEATENSARTTEDQDR